jgi:hypothetical protein
MLAAAMPRVASNTFAGNSSSSQNHSSNMFYDSGLLHALANEVGKPGFSPVGVLRGSHGTFAVISYITRKPSGTSSSGGSSSSESLCNQPWRADVWTGRAWQAVGTFPDQQAAEKAASYALGLVVDGKQ